MRSALFGNPRLNWLAPVALGSVLALGGCMTAKNSEATGALASADMTVDPQAGLGAMAQRYRDNPRDAANALRYGQALRASGQNAQAVAVLEQATLVAPGDRVLLGAYGRSLAENGQYKQALDVLNQAHTPDQPDWRILSVQGTVFDQLGRHDEARRYYASALKIAPEEPSILSNLGMSYILSKDLKQAEKTLRRAYAAGAGDARVQQNLALAVGLQGRADEAYALATENTSSEEAAARTAALRELLARPESARANAATRRAPAKPIRS